MAKQRTKSGWSKRLKVHKSGVISRSQAGRRHLLTSKSRKRKRRLRKSALLSKADAARIKSHY